MYFFGGDKDLQYVSPHCDSDLLAVDALCLITTLHSWPDWAGGLWALQGFNVTMTTGGCAQTRLAGLQQ